MIPKDFITEWRNKAPWPSDEQVEQDLVISRAIVEIFNARGISEQLAWRGGTALHKLYVDPAERYSEDIDLVQINAEPIGATLDTIRTVLDSWLGKPKRVLKEGRANLIYRFKSEGPPEIRLRLKVEINTREHFTEYGYMKLPFVVNSKWFKGQTEVTTFTIEELLATKLKALYQRKKGRDLFDIWTTLNQDSISRNNLINCFHSYMNESGHSVTRAQFEKNLAGKREDSRFISDIVPLLRSEIDWNIDLAMKTVLDELVMKLPGEPWRLSQK